MAKFLSSVISWLTWSAQDCLSHPARWRGNQPKTTAEILQAISAFNILLPGIVLVLASITFAAGRAIEPWIFPSAVFATSMITRFFTSSWQQTGRVVIIGALIHLIAMALSGILYENSWDALYYHQEAALRIAEGFNPFSGDSRDYGSGTIWGTHLWTQHYPKLTWILAAAVTSTGFSIEVAKFYNLTLIVAAACQVAATLLQLTSLRVRTVAIIAILAALNPVSICEFDAFLNDGAMAGLLTIAVAVLVSYLVTTDRRSLALLLIVVGEIIHLKFTGVVYGIVIIAAGIGWFLVCRDWRGSVRFALAGGAAGVVSVFLVGYSPYVRNWCEHGSPMHPVIGPHPVDIMTHVRPGNLSEKNRVSRFLLSSFSHTGTGQGPEASTKLKVPFTITRDELIAFRATPSIGGFGPFYGPMLLCAIVGMLLLLVGKVNTRRLAIVQLAIVGGIVASVLTHSECWKARFVPQAWLIALVPATLCLTTQQKSWPYRMGLIVLVLAAANVFVAGTVHTGWIGYYNFRARKDLRDMAQTPKPLLVNFGQFQALRQRFKERGLEFQQVDTPPPNREVRLIYTGFDQAKWYVDVTPGAEPIQATSPEAFRTNSKLQDDTD